MRWCILCEQQVSDGIHGANLLAAFLRSGRAVHDG